MVARYLGGVVKAFSDFEARNEVPDATEASETVQIERDFFRRGVAGGPASPHVLGLMSSDHRIGRFAATLPQSGQAGIHPCVALGALRVRLIEEMMVRGRYGVDERTGSRGRTECSCGAARAVSLIRGLSAAREAADRRLRTPSMKALCMIDRSHARMLPPGLKLLRRS